MRVAPDDVLQAAEEPVAVAGDADSCRVRPGAAVSSMCPTARLSVRSSVPSRTATSRPIFGMRRMRQGRRGLLGERLFVCLDALASTRGCSRVSSRPAARGPASGTGATVGDGAAGGLRPSGCGALRRTVRDPCGRRSARGTSPPPRSRRARCRRSRQGVRGGAASSRADRNAAARGGRAGGSRARPARVLRRSSPRLRRARSCHQPRPRPRPTPGRPGGAERAGERGGGFRPLLRVLGEAAEDQRLELRRHRTPQASRRGARARLQVMMDRLERALAREDRRAGEQEVADGAQGVKVAARVRAAGVADRLRAPCTAACRAARSLRQAGIDLSVRSLTRPKSRTLAMSGMPPRSHSRTLAGLMSRWMRPMPCASASAAQIWRRMRTARRRRQRARTRGRASRGRRRRGTP